MPDPEIMRGFNTTTTIAIIAVWAVTLVIVSAKGSTLARADRFSRRVLLPFGSDETRRSVAHGLRRRAIAETQALLGAGLVSGALLLTPLATSSTMVFYAVLTALVVGGVAAVVVDLRERLFHPAPTAPRIARARTMRVADYLDPLRRGLTWLSAAGAAAALSLLAVTALRSPARVDQTAATAAVVFAVIAALVLTAALRIERLVLAQPQPASDTLELAWDDAFRANAIMSLRFSCAVAAWFALSLAVAALWIGSDATAGVFATQLPTWGVIACRFVYPTTGRPLRPALYPEWLRIPAPAGGVA